MSIARAFTKRAGRKHDGQATTRSGTVRYAPGTINRNMISLPTELLSTTNVQALTAPDIRNISASSSDSSVSSGNDSDFSTIDRSFLSNAGTDTSSIESSPVTPITPPMENNKSFFDLKFNMPAPINLTPGATPETPAIPQRAPSHSKKAHVELSRKRSVQRMSPPPNNIGQPAVRTNTETFNHTSEVDHPFGRELAQVNEIAEEFGVASTLLEDEEQEILNKGLCKFGVEDYIQEITGLYGGVFEGHLGPMANPWV